MFRLVTTIRTWLASAAMLAAFTLSCGNQMDGDAAGRQMSNGLGEARSGLAQTQSGVDTFNAGNRPSGMSGISVGINTMSQGMADMRDGMNMMSGNMMMSCTDGGAAVLGPMQQAMDEMHTGQSTLMADAATDDATAMTHMQNGTTMMKTALDDAQIVMNCMGHGHMTSGGMH
jgi:hypothetical protein